MLGFRPAWQRQLGSTNNLITAQFADAPGAAFTVQGPPQNRNAAALGVDGRLVLYKDLQAFVDYSATFSSGDSTQGVMGGVSLK